MTDRNIRRNRTATNVRNVLIDGAIQSVKFETFTVPFSMIRVTTKGKEPLRIVEVDDGYMVKTRVNGKTFDLLTAKTAFKAYTKAVEQAWEGEVVAPAEVKAVAKKIKTTRRAAAEVIAKVSKAAKKAAPAVKGTMLKAGLKTPKVKAEKVETEETGDEGFTWYK